MNKQEKAILKSLDLITEYLISTERKVYKAKPLRRARAIIDNVLNPKTKKEMSEACDMSDLDEMDSEDAVKGGLGEK